MRILVNHLTRMQPGYICVAGIEIETARHIRPVLAGRRLTTDLLRRNGGPFRFGAVVDLGGTRPFGKVPNVEDCLFDPRAAAEAYAPEPANVWEFLCDVSRLTLAAIFGNALARRGHSCAVDIGGGTASLGSLTPATPPRLELDGRGRIRLHLRDGAFTADLPVTDLRLYEPDQQTVRAALVARLGEWIATGERTVLGVGLTRPFQRDGDAEPRHWLQVNSITLEGAPVWNDELAEQASHPPERPRQTHDAPSRALDTSAH